MIGFVLALLRGLVAMSLPAAIRLLAGLGFGYATYTGVKALIDSAESEVATLLGELSSEIVNLLAVMKVDSAITLLFSALIVRLTLQGMSALGTLTKWGAKPPPT